MAVEFRSAQYASGREKAILKCEEDLRIRKEGYLQKLSRGQNSLSILHFQRRYVIVKRDYVYYYKPSSSKKTHNKFDMAKIAIIEDVDDVEFGKYHFQVGNSEEMLYFGAKDETERTEWKRAFYDVAVRSKTELLSEYHPGVYGNNSSGAWSCCKMKTKASFGCRPSSQVDGAYYKVSANSDFFGHGYFFPTKRLEGETCRELKRLSYYVSTCPDTGDGVTCECEDNYVKFKMTPHAALENDGSSCGRERRKLSIQSKQFQELEHKHTTNYSSSVGAAIFVDVDILAVAEKQKLHIISTSSEEPRDIWCDDFQDDIIALKSWKRKLVVETINGVTLLDWETKSSRYTHPSNSFHNVDFTPDGAFLLGTDIREGKYVINKWDIRSQQEAAGSLYLPGKPKKLCVHPDPSKPVVVAMVPQDISHVLYLHFYNYNNQTKHCDKTPLASVVLTQRPHAVFSPIDETLLIGYGENLATVDISVPECLHQKILISDQKVTGIAVSPSGKELFVAQLKGVVDVLPHTSALKQHSSLEHGSFIDTRENANVTAVCMSNDSRILAIGSASGKLHLYRRKLPKHPVEKLHLNYLKVPQKGGVYHLADDITVEFPEGFVSVPSMGFYWNMYSPEQVLPLSFPQGIRPVSAILALHPEEDDIEFIKPIKITMPHCVFMKSAESCRYLAFSKASRKRSGGNRQNGKKLKFDKVSESATLFMKYTKGEENSKLVQPFASFCTQHCCYICMTKDSKENTDDTFFYLTQAIPKNRGESSYFSIHYVFSYCITGCFTTIEEQFPDSLYEKKRKNVLFSQSKPGIGIKIASHLDSLASYGWVPVVTKGDQITLENVYFWDYNPATLKSMCHQKLYPPRFTIEIKTNEYECMDTKMKVVFPGAKYPVTKTTYIAESDVEFYVDLKSSDVNSAAAKSRIHQLSLLSKLHKDGGTSEDHALRMCFRSIVEGVGSPEKFLMHLDMDSIVTFDQDKELQGQLKSGDDNKDLNYKIMKKVQINVSKDKQLFYDFCNTLEKMACFRFKKLLVDSLQRVNSDNHSSNGTSRPRQGQMTTV